MIKKGRIVVADPHPAWIEDTFRIFPLRDATLTREVVLLSRVVDVVSEDPAGRFIAATAIVYDLTLVTSDKALQMSTDFRSLPN